MQGIAVCAKIDGVSPDITTGAPARFFLFIGTTTADAAVSKLKAAGIPYRQKRLESGPDNWRTIVELLKSPELIGVVGKLTATNYGSLVDRPHAEVAGALLGALGRVPHIVFVHETVMTGKGEPPASPPIGIDDEDLDGYYEYIANHYFTPPPDEIRLQVNALLDHSGIDVVPYQTNAQVSVLAASFIEDNEKNLLFRLYVPYGRIYAAEADKLLSLFREWVTQVKRQRVRQDGYETGSGHVYEFFGDESASAAELTAQFDDFSRFLDLCGEAPDAARDELTAAGHDSVTAEDLVRRYGKEMRRLQLDLRQARETKLLSIRHRLESELIDVIPAASAEWVQIARIVEDAVPGPTSAVATLGPGPVAMQAAGVATVTINQNIIQSVHGTVIQGLQGTVNLGPEPKELLELIDRYGGSDAVGLATAVHELEDEDARQADRLEAKQRLKGFLFKLVGQVEESALDMLQHYVERKLGL